MEFPSDPYASHLPLLVSIAGLRGGVKRILELGPGLYSTPMFLNRDFFPQVTQVLSIEHYQPWADTVLAACADPRFDILVKPEPFEPYLDTLTLDEFDLIFVDNSDACVNRVATIEYLGERVTRSLVVIHDFHHPPYQAAARNFPNRIVDTRTGMPYTGLVWKGEALDYMGERCTDRIL